jgi:hypothetical protein
MRAAIGRKRHCPWKEQQRRHGKYADLGAKSDLAINNFVDPPSQANTLVGTAR